MKDWWLRRSLRVRLAVWYAITSTIILLALGGMLLFVVSGRLISQLDHQLREDFETVESSVVRDSDGDHAGLDTRMRNRQPVWMTKRACGSKFCLRQVQSYCAKGHPATCKSRRPQHAVKTRTLHSQPKYRGISMFAF